MKKEISNLDRLKGKNPFSIPEGYMEGLTDHIMSRIPEQAPRKAAKQISLLDRIRPWLYMAAVFAGLGLFFKVIVGPEQKKEGSDALLVNTEVPSGTLTAMQAVDDDEYLEFLEDRYASYILAEEIGETE